VLGDLAAHLDVQADRDLTGQRGGLPLAEKLGRIFTASGTSSPASARRTDLATEMPAFSWASSVEAPRCGVQTTLSKANSGESVQGSLP
jgi:hypothetical protein